jgi:hypothetical protein
MFTAPSNLCETDRNVIERPPQRHTVA